MHFFAYATDDAQRISLRADDEIHPAGFRVGKYIVANGWTLPAIDAECRQRCR